MMIFVSFICNLHDNNYNDVIYKGERRTKNNDSTSHVAKPCEDNSNLGKVRVLRLMELGNLEHKNEN